MCVSCVGISHSGNLPVAWLAVELAGMPSKQREGGMECLIDQTYMQSCMAWARRQCRNCQVWKSSMAFPAHVWLCLPATECLICLEITWYGGAFGSLVLTKRNMSFYLGCMADGCGIVSPTSIDALTPWTAASNGNLQILQLSIQQFMSFGRCGRWKWLHIVAHGSILQSYGYFWMLGCNKKPPVNVVDAKGNLALCM